MPSFRLSPMLIAAALAAAPAAARSGEARCDPARAARLAGEAALPDAEVRTLTGAGSVRRIAPGAPVTFDYRAGRITLEIADGKVVRASCG